MSKKREVNFIPEGAGILIEWKVREEKDDKVKIMLPDHVKQDVEMATNGVNRVASIGPSVVNYEIGDWIMLNIAGDMLPLVDIDGKRYALIRPGQIAGKFPEGEPTWDTSKGVDAPPYFTTNRRIDKKLKEYADKVTAPPTKDE